MDETTDRKYIAERLEDAGYRLTRQRLAILATLAGTKSHPDANWIYQEVHRTVPKISLATVYRNLRVLKSVGLIRELDYGPAMSHYDGNTSRHSHVVCVRCGRIEDLSLTDSELVQEARTATDFTITDCRVEFYGFCPHCHT